MLFDAGGVLLLPGGEQLSAMFAEVGVELEPARCRDAWSQALADGDQGGTLDPEWVVQRWVHHAGAPPDAHADACAALHAELRRKRIAWHETVDEVHETLAALRDAGLRLGCVSNSDGTVEHELGLLGLAEFFEVIIDSEVVGIEKPDPSIFAWCLGRMPGLEPGDCIYVGDTIHYDVNPATHAGLFACHFDRLGRYTTPTPHGVRITQLREVLALVASGAET